MWKSAGGDSVGLLGRWRVLAKEVSVVAKEIDREIVAGESFAQITPDPHLIYESHKQNSVVTNGLWIRNHRAAEIEVSVYEKVAKKAKLNFRTVRRALNREPIQERNLAFIDEGLRIKRGRVSDWKSGGSLQPNF